jgi:NADH-quinone oxidoreductase subunit G
MTLTTNNENASLQPAVEMVTAVIDGFEVTVPKGTLVIRAAETLGIQIPRFCDHPLLDPVGACRQCLVEVEVNGRAFPKPQASCTMPVEDGMVVKTQLTSAVADKAQQGNMEFLLINHPLDCPVCDKGGECPLQNQAMSNGRGTSRFEGVKRTFVKPVKISSQVLLDRERCVLCARCTRFSEQVAGDPFIALVERGALQQVGIYEKEPFESYFSGNTVQICPVGALTSASYRFRARPFDLVSTPTACEHCAAGCALRTDARRYTVVRRLAGDDPNVNEEWNCDKGRWAFAYATTKERLTTPMVRDADSGELVPTSWPDAISVAAEGLLGKKSGVLVGGRATVEEAYAFAKFARLTLGTNDVDFRARAHSEEEAAFLGSAIAGRLLNVTYAKLDAAPAVLLVGFEPEEESPIVFLRLRKAARKGLKIFTIAPFASRGSEKLSAQVISTRPGEEAAALASLPSEVGDALRQPGAILLVGERLAQSHGAFSSALQLAAASGAKIAWVPRRAGERGALEAGAIGALLPGGRPVSDPVARVDIATAWGVPGLPTEPGRTTSEILADAASGALTGLVVAGVDPYDLPDPDGALAALEQSFVVSFELRESAVTSRADVVFPVAPVVEKSGTFLDWEGRSRPFAQVLATATTSPDLRILAMLASAMGTPLGFSDAAHAKREFEALGPWDGERLAPPALPAASKASLSGGQAILATWRNLLDLGTLQEGEPTLAGTARAAVARVSAATAASAGASQTLTISTDRGSITLPLFITEMVDDVVWIPENSSGSQVRRSLGVGAGAIVTITGGVR